MSDSFPRPSRLAFLGPTLAILALVAGCGDDDALDGPSDAATDMRATAPDSSRPDAAVDPDAFVAPDSAVPDSGLPGTDATIDAALDSALPDPPDAGIPTDLGPPTLGECSTFAPGEDRGAVTTPEIAEASGIVASRAHPSVLWVHNDSGDSARVFAISDDASHLGTVTLEVPNPRDVEDMAIAPSGDGGWSIYLGDIGDNPSTRTSIAILRFREPSSIPPERPFTLSLPAERITITYPDGAHNAETLLADPVTGDLYIAEKTDAAEAGIYRIAAASLVDGESVVAERVATIAIGVTTGGDVSPDGSEIIVRGYGRSASLWRRVSGTPFSDAFTTEACEVPIHAEIQGESLGFAADGSAYLTLSEGEGQTLYRYARE